MKRFVKPGKASPMTADTLEALQGLLVDLCVERASIPRFKVEEWAEKVAALVRPGGVETPPAAQGCTSFYHAWQGPVVGEVWEPDSEQRCVCGSIRWKDREDLRRTGYKTLRLLARGGVEPPAQEPRPIDVDIAELAERIEGEREYHGFDNYAALIESKLREVYEAGLRSARSSPPPERPQECAWTPDDDGIYQTGCGHSFTFDTDGPTENHQHFCGYCGKSLVDCTPRVPSAPHGAAKESA
jgi:hypothetical protein